MVNKEKLLANAQKFISKGQISKAISEYETLVGAFPKDVRNRQKLAELFSRDKRDQDALKEYEAVARHYTETGFYLKAIAVFKQMQKIDPSRLDIYHRLAELNEKQGLIGNALTEYRNLVAHYEKKQLHQEAADVLEKMLELDPENLNVAAKIAECCMALGQQDQAYAQFQAVVEALVAQGDQAKIIKLYDHFIGICPEDGVARLPLARALLDSGSAAKALQILRTLVKHSPDDAAINRCLADAYVAVEDFANARLTLSHLLKQHKDDPDLREYYVRVCIYAGEAERARDRLEEWKDNFFQNERPAVLLNFYEELEALLPGDLLVAATLADVREALGDPARRKPPETAAQASAESPETAADAVLEMAFDDVEALDMVGEEASADIEVPSLDALAADPGRSTEQPPEEELELNLDLDDLDDPALQVEDGVLSAEGTGLAAPDDAEEEMEVELEVDLEDMDDFELDFDEDPSAVAAGAAEEVDAEVEADQSALTDGLDGYVGAEQAESLAADEHLDQQERSETFLADGVPDFAAEELDLTGEELDLAVEDPDSPVEELDLAGEELDLTGEELGHAGAEDGHAAEVFFALEEEGGLTDAAGFAESGEPLAESYETRDELAGIEELEVLEDLPDAADAGAMKVEAELEEVQFYLQQGLYDDAERLVRSLMEACPETPELQAELAGIEQARQTAASEVEGEAFVDLMSDLQDEDLLDATGFLDSFADGGHDDDLSQKLVSELDSADTESHYNLGIAYKEMGLYDEAIAEFDKAAKDPGRNLDCITLTGQCHLEVGNRDAALAVFKSGLADPGLSDIGRMTLNFELGILHQLNGELLEALDCFQLVAEKDTFFREVSELIKSLRKQLGLDNSDDGGPQGNRDRVSYV